MKLISTDLSTNIRNMEIGETKHFAPKVAQSVATLCSSIGFQMGRKYATKRDKDLNAQLVTRLN